MIKKTHLLYIALTFGIAFSAIFFIIKSNDHKECETVIKKSLDENGREVLLTTEHVCKEKYNI